MKALCLTIVQKTTLLKLSVTSSPAKATTMCRPMTLESPEHVNYTFVDGPWKDCSYTSDTPIQK